MRSLTTNCPQCGSLAREVNRTDDKEPHIEKIIYLCSNSNCTYSNPEICFVRKVKKVENPNLKPSKARRKIKK